MTLAMFFFFKSLCLHGETLLIRDDTAKIVYMDFAVACPDLKKNVQG